LEYPTLILNIAKVMTAFVETGAPEETKGTALLI
jgi:hypothetical protein